MPAMKGGRLVLGAAVAVLALAGYRQAAASQLRSVEEAYVAGRQVTACATARLGPLRRSEDPVGGLPAALDEILAEARTDADHLGEDVPSGLLLPPTGGAQRAVRRALSAQRALYEAMVETPLRSDDELRGLGSANAAAERSLSHARTVLLLPSGRGWAQRNTCVQASSAPSSSK
jgi:hypothetical protein